MQITAIPVEQQLGNALTYIEELKQDNAVLSQENIALREENAQERDEKLSALKENAVLGEEITAERQAHEQTRQTLAMERRRYGELDARHTDLYMKWTSLFLWTKNLFRNRTFPNANTKLVLFYLYLTLCFSHLNDDTGSFEIGGFDEERRVPIATIAEEAGCSEDTARKALKKLDEFGVTTTRHEDIILQDGTKHRNALTIVKIHESAKDASQIKMENKQGGDHSKPFCPYCGNEELESYTARYCPCCNKTYWFNQIGTPAEANVFDAIKADHVPHGKLSEHDKSNLLLSTNTAIAKTPETQDVTQSLASEPDTNSSNLEHAEHDKSNLLFSSNGATCHATPITPLAPQVTPMNRLVRIEKSDRTTYNKAREQIEKGKLLNCVYKNGRTYAEYMDDFRDILAQEEIYASLLRATMEELYLMTHPR